MGEHTQGCRRPGQRCRNVIIEQSFGSPKITKDSVTVAKSITLKDKFENLGACLIHDVAQKMNEIVGDETMTTTVLARAIYAEGVKNVAAGCNPMDLRCGSQAAVDHVIEFLSVNTKKVMMTAKIAQVTTISTNGDTHIGNLIAQAMEKVGKEGIITIKEGRTIKDKIEITEGMRFDCGFISPYFITDVKAQKVEFEKPFILLSEKKISILQDILPSLEAAAQLHHPLVIIAKDVDGEALATCILNKHLALVTTASQFSVTLPYSLMLLSLWTNWTSSSKRLHLIFLGLLVPLPSHVVTKVGVGSSEVEVREKKDRYDDSLNATRAAVKEGILPGGGVALLKALLALVTTSNTPGSTNPQSNPDAKIVSSGPWHEYYPPGIDTLRIDDFVQRG
ncbi:TCP-1/cpn60 chaperonin family-domain-containing protein [Boletus reticuloceps]|uniref:TCP-1/cpn60 chaperonin family-domain-containing protein n=1 Tax=Boletus reticuloceps TaxID=495285 RepID=A0A8I2YEB4_9AGAM|nr:TCP-1/cpn60 chaperonin family-domain-containing protein [Boletus reticuloceps]KAG6370987.1 TCP-1/cpn60 chaperonin family-domain-containing protein [Boletus reticuloceps]